MAENRTLNTRLRLKYDTAANWATKNPVLLAGEVGIESDTLLGKVGDGEKTWQQLEYLKTKTDGVVRFDIAQSLNDTQKAQARSNIDAAKSDHTHNYAGSDSVGGAAKSANKVNSNLIVKLNNGETEGTNLFTFNGSAAKTINITPSAIGAAASSHGTHVTADTVKAALGTGSGTSKYLREDGTWQIPPDTHYTNYLQINGNGTEAVKFTQNDNKILNFKSGANVSIAAASGEITISATNTDTKVTSVDNHYLPIADSRSELTATINGAAGTYAKDTEYTVLTGIKVQRDAKGHITGITYTAQKIKDTNTTYTIPTKSSWNYDDRYVKYTEVQELDSTQKEQARSNIGAGTSNLTLAGNGSATTAAKSDHTHNYAGSSSAGGAATSANKVNAALTFNNSGNGAVSGTAFDGSTAKIISYNTIGAAASSHNHDDRYYTETEINTKLSGKSDTNHNHDDKYLGKTAKAADSDKLDGKDSTYYLNYNNLDNTPSNATTSTPGLMSASDKTKLDSIATGAKGTITGIMMNGESKGTSDVVDLGTVLTDASKFATSAQGTKADNAMPKSGGTFTGEVKFDSTENFQGYYIKRMLGSLNPGTRYADLDSSYKDGTYHRMWRLRFPSGSSFWGKIKVTLYGDYSSFNASGLMSKSITCNFNTSNIYNNVGCYDGLGVNVEQDFRISEAIWNATANAWEVLIWQKNLNGNNPATIMLECWTKNNTNYINAFNGIAAQPVELTQSTSYSAQRASSTGGTKTVEWATLPVYENPLGEEIATVAMLEDPNTHYTNYLQIKGNGSEAVKFTQDANKTLNFKPGTNVSIAAVSGEITINATDTTYNAATQSVDGLMSKDDKKKLDGIAAEATKVTSDTISGWGYTKNKGTVTQVKVGTTAYNPSDGVVSIPAYPTSLKNPNSMTIKAGADTVSSYDGSASKTFTVAASTTAGAFTISDGTTTKTIQLAGKFTDTDTNTATAADNILDGSNNGTQITYAPYTSQQSKLSFDTSTTNPTRTDRLNLNGYLYATKLYSNGKEVLTSHQNINGKLDKTTYEWNKEFAAGSNGAISLGRYNVYDSQLTFDISSTTSISMNGKLVIATQNGRICQAKVFGDANGVLVSKIVIYQSAIVNNRSWIEVFCKFDGWSKNKVHIYGVALNSATVTNQMSSVTFTNGIPSPITSGDSQWSGTIDNDLSNWTGDAGTVGIYYGSMTFSAKSGDTYGTAGFDMNNAGDVSCGGWSVDENTAHLRLGIDGACDIELGENAGTAGQVLISQGAGNTPIWETPAIKSATLDKDTKTLTLTL